MARPRSDIQPRIIQAARQRFLAQGVDGTSLRELAADAKTNIGMVYYYFPDKDALFLAVVETDYERVLADFARALGPELPAGERLRRFFQRVGSLSDGELEMIRLIVREALSSSARLTRLLERMQRGHFPLVLATIRDGLADGTFEPTLHPLVLGLATFALAGPAQLISRVAQRIAPVPAVSGTALSDQLLEVLLHGTAPRKPGAPPVPPVRPAGRSRAAGSRSRRPATRG